MSRRALIRPVLASFLAWIAIAEILDANFFLGINTIAATIYVLIEPWLRAGEPFPLATDDTAPPSDPVPFAGARGVAPAATRRER